MKRPRPRTIIKLCACVLLFAAGCTSRNVTSLSKYQVGYLPGHVYELNVERELVHAEWNPKGLLCFVEPGTCDRGADWLQPFGSLPAGSQIQINQLRYETNINLSDVDRCVVAYGRLLDGPHAGAQVVMVGVSKLVDFPQATLRSKAMVPDPAFVQEATPLPDQ